MAITDIKEYAHLTEEDVEALGRELDAIRLDIEEKRGAHDARYIQRTIAFQRSLMVAGRIVLFASKKKPAWILGGTALLGGSARSSRTWNSATTSSTASGTG